MRFALIVFEASLLAAGQDEPFRISADVKLVVLHASIHNRDGSSVPDLPQQGLAVYEDGVRQAIRFFAHENVPVTVGLIVDHSGSMRPKLNTVTRAAAAFIEESRSEDEMFVVNFNEKVSLALPGPLPFSSNPALLTTAIANTRAAGKTALYDAILKGFDHLSASSREKKVLLVISDGGDNASTHTVAEVLAAASLSDAVVYTIGISSPDDPDRNPRFLRRIASATGGEAFIPDAWTDVVPICRRIAQEIRSQYTIGYVSNRTSRPGVFRRVRVNAQNRNLVVRTRAGYTDR